MEWIFRLSLCHPRFAVGVRLACLLAPLSMVALAAPPLAAQEADQAPLTIDIAKPAASWIASQGQLPTALPSFGLRAAPPETIGWFDFRVTVPHSGWWRLSADRSLPATVRVAVDPASEAGMASASIISNDWIWLDAGTRRLRLLSYFWGGFPSIEHLSLVPAPTNSPALFRVDRDKLGSVFPLNQCLPLPVIAGGANRATELQITFRSGDRTLATRKVKIHAGPRPENIHIDLPCAEAGDVKVEISAPLAQAGRALTATTKLTYSVFDTTPVQPTFQKGAQVAEIDAATRAPDFDYAGTRVVQGSSGAYRETIPVGLSRPGQPRNPDSRGWFAYRIDALTPGKPYLMEVEYPDDASRVFIAAYRDRGAQPPGPARIKYALSVGVETGAKWPNSGTMKTMQEVIWPQSSDGRVIILNFNDGERAAIARIRFYELHEQDGPPRPAGNGRDSIIWYEEGDNFRNLVGLGDASGSLYVPVDRLTRLTRASGATVFMPTAIVYAYQLYPSRYNVAFNDQARDTVAAFLLSGQRYGLKVIPEIYPRADELLWDAAHQDRVNRRLLLSAEGTTNRIDSRGRRSVPPHFNMLDPDVRAFYVNLVRELAERYRDFPSFAGVSVRTSAWVNGAFNNFVSLDWGYNPEIIRQYFNETGVPIPAQINLDADPSEAARHWRQVLLTTQREKWITWRCTKVAELYRTLSEVVRAARPDLRLVLDLSVMSIRTPAPDKQTLREAGIDLDLLAAIPGLEIVDARFLYGAIVADHGERRAITDAAYAANALAATTPEGQRPSVLFGMQYHELPGENWPSVKIGLPKLNRNPWVSAAVEPPPPYNRERYARIVAENDVFAIGNGGNGYVFLGAGIDDFFSQFNALPRVPFSRIAHDTPPLVGRENGQFFYIVNVSSQTVPAVLQFRDKITLTSLVDGKDLGRNISTYCTSMAPFSIQAFKADADRPLASVNLARPKAEQRQETCHEPG